MAVALKASTGLHVPMHYAESISVLFCRPCMQLLLFHSCTCLRYRSAALTRARGWRLSHMGSAQWRWPMRTRDFYADPLLAVLMAAALLLTFEQGAWWMIMSATALAVLAKPTGIILGPILSAYLLWKTRRFWLSTLPGIGSSIGLVMYFLYNSYRFGNFRTFGPPWDFSFKFVPQGVAEMLISPGEGLIWYCPCVILSMVALSQIKTRRLEAWTITALAAASVLLHSFYPRLGLGGWSWGPRHLLPILPGLLALTGVLSNAWRKVLVLSAILGFVLTVPNLVSFYTRYFAEANEQGITNEEIMWSPGRSPVIAPVAGGVSPNTRRAPLGREPVACSTDWIFQLRKFPIPALWRTVAVWWWVRRLCISHEFGERRYPPF